MVSTAPQAVDSSPFNVSIFAMHLFAQNARDGINNWLNENPIMIGVIFVPLGLILVLSGVYSLSTGSTQDKYGNEITGGLASFTSIIRIVVGIGCVGFGIYKAVMG